LWQPELHRSLRSILGNLINLPLESENLRDWIEKISNDGLSGGKTDYEHIDYVPLSNYGDVG
jgi:hypothetical protein